MNRKVAALGTSPGGFGERAFHVEQQRPSRSRKAKSRRMRIRQPVLPAAAFPGAKVTDHGQTLDQALAAECQPRPSSRARFRGRRRPKLGRTEIYRESANSAQHASAVTIWMPAIEEEKPPKNIGRVPMEAP